MVAVPVKLPTTLPNKEAVTLVKLILSSRLMVTVFALADEVATVVTFVPPAITKVSAFVIESASPLSPWKSKLNSPTTRDCDTADNDAERYAIDAVAYVWFVAIDADVDVKAPEIAVANAYPVSLLSCEIPLPLTTIF